MKKRIIAMVLSVAMMLTMFPTGVLADDFIENTEGVTVSAEGQSNDDQGEESDTAQVNVDEDEETQHETVKPENEQTEPGQTENGQTEPTQNETDQAKPDQTETDQTEQTEPGSTVPDQAGTTPDNKQPEPEQPATDPAEDGVSDGAESTEGEQAESKTEFTVTWESEGETILTKTFAEGTSKDEVENAQPAEAPVKEADGDVEYTFAGWTPDYADVTADQTYTAKFEEAEQDEMVNTASLVEPADIKDESVTLVVGDKPTTLTGSAQYGSVRNHSWESSSDAVSFTNKNGNTAEVKADKASTTPVTIKHTYEQWKSEFLGFGSWKPHTDTWKITVNAPVAATGVELKTQDGKTGEAEVTEFQTLTLVATPVPNDATGTYQWHSDNDEVLSVQGNGNTATVTGKVRNQSAKITVQFTPTAGEVQQAEIQITVKPDEELSSKAQALVYYLIDPNGDVNSNNKTIFGDRYGEVTVNTAGMVWNAGNGRNCTTPDVKNRVVDWPDGYKVVEPQSSHWYAIFNKYKATVENELGVTIEEKDVEEIRIIPAKISRHNSSTPDCHVDCNVQIVCKKVATVKYYLQDVGDDAPKFLGSKNYITGKETKPSDVTDKTFPETKDQGDVTYTFKGWYTDPSFTNGPVFMPQTVNGSTDYYAKYVAGRSVTYDLNGGTWKLGSQNNWTEQVDEGFLYTVKGGESTQLQRTGYTFAGWKVDGESIGDKTEFNAGDKFTMPGRNVTLVAQWKANSYTVTYEDGVNGTAFAEQVKTADYGAATPAFEGEPTRTGYTFAGWNPEVAKTVTDSVTYTAQWTINSYTVTYEDGVNGAAFAEQVKTADYGSATPAFEGEPTRTGYTFAGWNPEVAETVTDNVTYTATWEKRTDLSYTVKYQWNGQPIEGKAPKTVGGQTYGSEVTEKPIKIEGYTIKPNQSGKLEITTDSEKNVIIFNYYKNVTLTANSNEKPYIYDGKAKEVKDYTASDNAATFEDITARGTGTNAGKYDVKFAENPVGKISTDDKYIVTAATDGTLTITKRNVTLTSASDSKMYDGTPLTNREVTASGDGFVKDEGATYDVTGSQTVVGSSDNKFTYTLNNGTNADNYTITTSFGKLEVTNRAEKYEITINANSDTKTYNGKEQEVTGFVTNEFTVNGQKYTVSGLSAKASGTDVGTYPTTKVTGTAVVTDADGNDVTAQFTVKPENGTLTINAKKVTITAKDNTGITYDGQSHGGNGYEATEVAEGDKIDSVTISGSKVDAGVYNDALVPSDAKIINAKDSRDVTKNYEFTYRKGKLEIKPVMDEVVVSIKGENDTVSYDGNPHTVNGYGYAVKIAGNPSNLYKDTDFKFTGEAKATGTDANTYAMGLAENQFANTSKNFTNVKFNVEDGWLRINPREGVVVTITGNTNTVPYNGVEQSVEGYTVEFTENPGDLYKVADFKLNGEAKAAGTDAGTYNMGFVATSFENANPNFKNVVFNITDGWLKITPKEIVPGENNKDLTATAPEDVVYSGESQQQKPIVKDGDKVLEEGKDYTLTYSEDTTNAGTVTVTITGNGNYGSKFEVTYKITPASLKITTNSAEKTYDGSALTADGKIEGVVERDKNDVKLNITGSQTEVGESKNTYKIEWGTAKASNYEITEDLGTLKVNARSGGGSSSKPTPEDEPTPTPTPTPLPTLPTTPAPTTPTRRVTRSTATVTEPASRPTEQITENETPKAESEPEVIEDEETPLAPMAGGAWALVNLILMLLTVLASLLLLLGYLGKKKYAKEDEYGNALHDANGNEIIDYTRNKKGFWRVASLIPAIAAVIAFALTENMRLPMVMTDRWTLLMVIIAVVQLIVAVLCKKKKESEEDENQANA